MGGKKTLKTEGKESKSTFSTYFYGFTRKIMILLIIFIMILLYLQFLLAFRFQEVLYSQETDYHYLNYYLKYPPIESEPPEYKKTIARPETTKSKFDELDREWLHAMRNNEVVYIDFNMTKGFSNKYKIYFEGGYVAVAKPVMSIEDISADLDTVDYYRLSAHHKNGLRTGLVDRRLTQGWSEIAAYHLDRVLKFYRKPPITGRIFTNHFFFAFNDSEESQQLRNMRTFEYPMALVGWMDNIRSLIPTYDNLGDILLMEVPVNRSIINDLKSVSDTILFDFLVDDHDKHNLQNWVGYVTKGEHYLLFWDSGLAWLHGPEGWETCYNLLCGPKDWRVALEGYNDTHCRPICRFNRKTVDNLRMFGDNDFGNSLGYLLEESLRNDPLYPVFTYGIFHAKDDKSETTKKVHYLPENFFRGLDQKVIKLLEHVDRCIEKYGVDEVFLQ